MAAVIEAHELTRKFKGMIAVEDLSMDVSEGEVLGFLGPNGAGKTTTIRMLAGIISPTSGYATVAGHSTSSNIEQLHQIIGLLTETPGFYENLSARRNLEFYAGFYYGLDITSQVDKYLRLMGLWERRENRVSGFSKGMKQRLALARALVHEPRVLLLDEPTAGLDPEAASNVRDIVRDLSREGRTIFLSTHNLSEAESLCHRIAVVKTRLLALDTADNLRRRLFRRHVIVGLVSLPEGFLDQMKSLSFVRQADIDENQIRFELGDAEKDRPRLIESIVAAGGQVMEVLEEEHSLEDVYLNLVRENKNDN